MLWIALHLPLLSLESFAATFCRAADTVPLALLDTQRIAHANAAAQALGVKPGMKRATALALAPQLILGQADARRDAQALETVAHIALAFTPSASIQPAQERAATAQTVLLEVQRSLRYFGGLPALLLRLHQALAGLGHRIHCVSTPTAQGAALLARIHPQLHCPDLAALRTALDTAPVWLLGPGRKHGEALQGMGLRTLADLRRLPRAGVARRFGQALLGELDRARGVQPDPREAIVLPQRFDARIELFARADTTEQVLQGASVLLARLVAWLVAQHAQVRHFTLEMLHETRLRSAAPATLAVPMPMQPMTLLPVALAEPSRDPAHLLVLLRERLARLRLSAPTLELRLRADEITHRAPPNSELFPAPGSEAEGLTRLVERLRARLGHEQVQGLVLVHDHRPERSSPAQAAKPAAAAAVQTGASRHGAPRPVWLLAEPVPLAERQSRPWFEGRALQLLSGPERIETGWWDAGLAERDYFIAQAPDGALLWIYRGRLPLSAQAQGWFLQGRFA
ncbi:MAG: DNA polymerase Y family protein [Burkholderiaceae bacterium]